MAVAPPAMMEVKASPTVPNAAMRSSRWGSERFGGA